MAQKAYEIITAQILEKLETGTVPWQKPWKGGQSGIPKNMISKKSYRGVNIFLLGMQGYGSPWWLTYKQATQLGGHVKKGEKGTRIIYCETIKKKAEKPEDEEKSFFMLRYYTVFNFEQCEELPAPEKIELPEVELDPIEEAELLIEHMPQKTGYPLRRKPGLLFPELDYINVPKLEQYEAAEEYYCTIFHELGHATGHKDRLDRPDLMKLNPFGSHGYGREELVAELTASFLCGHCGIESVTIDNSAAYIRGWMKTIKEDQRMVIWAAAQAQKATDFILDIEKAKEEAA